KSACRFHCSARGAGEDHSSSTRLRAAALRAWFDRCRARAERGSAARRPARSRASSRGKRCNQWRRYDQIFGDDRRVGWRQRSRLRTACCRDPSPEPHHLWSTEAAAILGSAAWRPALRKNRRLSRDKVTRHILEFRSRTPKLLHLIEPRSLDKVLFGRVEDLNLHPV